MSTARAAAEEDRAGQARPRAVTMPDSARTDDFWIPGLVLALLVAVELVTFGPVVRNVGFYLDDWLMLFTLRFGPQDYLSSLANFFLTDPKVIIRPVEVLHFGTLYHLFGIKPLGYHIFNGIFEIAAAWFLFMSLARLTGNRLIAFLASLGSLTYPVHDSTHYWVLCSSVPLSLASYLLSLWLTVEAVLRGRVSLHVLSVLSFAFSIYGYESFLPLCIINAACAFLLFRQHAPVSEAIRQAVLVFIPFVGVIGTIVFYQRVIVPLIGTGWLHQVRIDPALVLRVVGEGVMVNLPTSTFPFFAEQAGDYIKDGLSATSLGLLVALAGSTAAVSWHLFRSSRDPGEGAGTLVILGAALALASFTIFGLNPEYRPTLVTIINRINTGAACGLSMMIAGLAGLLLRRFSATASARACGGACLIAITTALLAFFTITSWQLAKPWVVSWSAQKNLFHVVSTRHKALSAGDSLMLANYPRYVMWSPVFDGIWDFQPMVRIATGNGDVKAGVVSERLELSETSARDISSGFLCADYPFHRMFVLTSRADELIEIRSARHFTDTIEKNGLDFGLDKTTIDRWRRQISIPPGGRAH